MKTTTSSAKAKATTKTTKTEVLTIIVGLTSTFLSSQEILKRIKNKKTSQNFTANSQPSGGVVNHNL